MIFSYKLVDLTHFLESPIPTWDGVGIDTLSADRPEDGFKVHQALLGAGKILIENVANLDSRPPCDSYVMILPLAVQTWLAKYSDETTRLYVHADDFARHQEMNKTGWLL